MKRDIVVGFLVLVLLAAGIYYVRRPRTSPPTATPTPQETEKKFEDKFKLDIPDDVEKVELKDLTNSGLSAFATRKFADNKFSQTVLAGLNEPEQGTFYQGWLIRGKEGDSNYSIISTGRFRIAKGGWLLEYQSGKDYSDHSIVLITQEKVFDSKPEKKLLEGSF